jgi:hypothetical protein
MLYTRRSLDESSHDAPQVDSNHSVSPTTNVESNPKAASSTPKRTPYHGMAFHRVKALGLIKDDAGDDSNRTEIGKNSRPEKSELCVKSASADRAVREFPIDRKPAG